MAVESFDTVVVGSGFGGSVVSYRLAEAGKKVLVLERGQKYPPGSFGRTIPTVREAFWDPSNKLYGRYNVWFFKKVGALVSSGLGGGSLIYANVLVRKPAEWFDADERWPVTYDELVPHYEAVERIIRPTPYPSGGPYDVDKVMAFRRAATALAARDRTLSVVTDQLPLAIAFSGPGEPLGKQLDDDNLHHLPRRTCMLCGECLAGCNYGAKSTLDFNYLSLAEKHGADIRTSHEVCRFRAISDDEIELDYIIHDPIAKTKSDVKTLRTKRLVIAAGTMGSTYLMLKNRGTFGAMPALGTKFSGNGDQLGFALDCNQPINAMFGPNITTALRGADRLDGTGSPYRGFYIEDAGFPHEIAWMAEGFQLGGWISRSIRLFRQMIDKMWCNDRDPDFGDELSRFLGDSHFSTRFMPLLAMGRDYPEGTFSLTAKDDPDAKQYMQLEWTEQKSTEYFERVTEVMTEIATQLGGKFMRNLPTSLFSREVTVHPLGGCPMGTDPTTSVVDSFGRSHVHKALHVIDGSILPASVGPNPSLTIAAIANRAADRLV